MWSEIRPYYEYIRILCEFAIINSNAELNSSAKVWFACGFRIKCGFMNVMIGLLQTLLVTLW